MDHPRLRSLALRRDAGPPPGAVPEVTSQQAPSHAQLAWSNSPLPTVAGKFIYVGESKLPIRGVTYGTFRPDSEGNEFPPRHIVAEDFRLMAASGMNAVRTYTVPPRWLLDDAYRNGLRVWVGLAAERYVGYLNDGSGTAITRKLRADVRPCRGHPAVLCYAVANEIPASTVRWFGRRRIERFIARLCDGVRKEDPNALVTYVNYPSTEYLQLPFLDLVSFNVYLESPARFAAYLARLQNIAGERPLVMAELGLDSLRNGERVQAASLVSQIETAFSAGCAGTFVYSWTDEWHRGGEDVDDWKFGLTRRDRRPKLALAAVRDAFAAAPFSPKTMLPRVSVIVCSFNGARTLRDCLDGILELDYPDFEVIVVDDGSTDNTKEIAAGYPVRLITTDNRGLSSARNTGLEAATGEIVAYIDDDARPDNHWLQYLVRTFGEGEWAAVGGPNLAPATDGWVADCVDNSPGGPIHVLLSDREAEHIPGCNMAFRRSILQEIGGFDPRFRVAGDDVDVCWRLQAHGARIGFSPAAVVWHHRRQSLSAYMRQQRGYGASEPLLARKWPYKYSWGGHVAWGGRLYGKGLTRQGIGARRWRIYYGTQGTGLFQSIYQPGHGRWSALPQLPEWYLLIVSLALLCGLGLTWAPLMLSVAPLLAGAVGALGVQALRSAGAAKFATRPASRRHLFKMRSLTALLHALQPAARLWGRLSRGLPSWRHSVRTSPRLHLRWTWSLWSTRWMDSPERLLALERWFRGAGARVRRGGDFDRWDIEVEVGALMRARLLMGIEEHGGGAQLVRLRLFPRPSAGAVILLTALGTAVLGAGFNHAAAVTFTFVGLLTGAIAWLLWEAALLYGAIADAVERADSDATPLSRLKHRKGVRLES